MIIAHPPCTYLCRANTKYMERVGRRDAMKEGAEFFRACLGANAPRVCVENPVPMRAAGLPKHTQIVHPWMFGDGEKKETCLWLKGLPALVPTKVVSVRTPKKRFLPPGPLRPMLRSLTPKGLAAAMVSQWGRKEVGLFDA